jgi:hypothetical protein
MGMIGTFMAYPQIAAVTVFCFSSLTVGLIALVWPEKMQRYALKRGTKFYFFWPNPFLEWMKTSGYIVYLRFMGIFFLLVGLFVLLIALGGKPTTL